MFEKLINYFIPAKTRNSNQNIRSSRILIVVLLLTGLFDLISIPNAFQLHSNRLHYLLLINGLLSFAVAFLFKKGVSEKHCTHIFIGQHAISFCLQSWDGGGLESPSTAALFLLPATTMLIIGKKGASFWFLFAIATMSFFYWYETQFGAPPVQYDISRHTYFLFVSLIGTTAAIFIILLVYENEKNTAIANLQKQHDDLVITQAKLIQSEKMASLGELTAGIAHEIQNPLNFVNNFSELIVELTQEIKDEMDKPQPDKLIINELVTDLIQNQEKILHHGKRASGIVKGMLEHSRTSTGKHELTDINALVGEFLHLAYHGLRAKDNSFNATLITEFDPKLQPVQVIPQDMGRVFLNLINNAFYAVQKKRLVSTGTYEPTVWVSTKRISNTIQISIRDNGTGIPEHVKTKIFQPFFTTKPTGEGTGLGLSLSYDIVTVAHNGRIDLESTLGEGTEFMVNLPVKS